MMSSESSTERGPSGPAADAAIKPWHFYLLLSMAAATWAVLVSPHTHPAALALLSAAIIATGVVGAALHHAVAGFFGVSTFESTPPSARTREALESDKALILRSIKELEFDRAMGKVSDSDFADLSSRLRARALAVLEELDLYSDKEIGSLKRPDLKERKPHAKSGNAAHIADDLRRDADRGHEEIGSVKRPDLLLECGACGTSNDADARFCKACGGKLP